MWETVEALGVASCFTNESMFSTINQKAPLVLP